MKLQLYLPTKPSVINQPFGVNPTYYDKFGYNGHNGVDFAASHGTPLYAVCDGQAMYNKDDHGGDGIILNTTFGFDYNGSSVPFNIIMWHMCPANDPIYPIQIPCDGEWHNVVAGQLLGYADNTGAPYESSGDHLHFGLVPLNPQWTALEPSNGFGGCIDPMPYFNGITIEDYLISTLVNKSATIANEVAADTTIEPEQKLTFIQIIEKAIERFVFGSDDE